ncbi:MAG: ABC transporter ATP-binding protein/permease [Clostridium sp.]|nr:ABC transporter ATP-binding protein/permease [Clostridium sp.]
MKTILFLVKFTIRKERHLPFYFLSFTVCTGISALLSMLFLQLITAAVCNPHMQNPTLLVIFTCVGFAIFIILTKSISTAMYFKADSRFTFIRTDIQNDISYRIMNLPFESIESRDFLEKNERALKSLESSNKGVELILKTLFQFPGSILSLISAFFILATIRLYLPLFFIPYLTIGLWMANKCARFRETLQSDTSKNQIQMDYLFDSINDTRYAKELRIFNLRNLFFHKLSGKINQMTSLLHKEEHFRLVHSIIAVSALFVLSSIACMAFVITGYHNNNVNLSQLVVTIYAVINIYQYSDEIFEQKEKIIFELNCVKEIFCILNTENANFNMQLTDCSDRCEYEWEIYHLTFQYPNSNKYALQDISFKLRPNEHIAIVGLNGAGKSTLIKCMTGLYQNYQGKILFRGNDIRNIPIHILTQYIGVQYQDADVYPFTIKENIASSCRNADTDRIWDCLSAVFSKETLRKFSSETETVLENLFDENGVVLSGGERESFLFARILYQNPDSIILDEPTARLDSIAEGKIISKIESTFANKCVIFISHRFGITHSLNRILLLKDGNLIGDGDHQKLIQHCSEYRRLIEVHKHYYDDERSNL